MTGGVFHEPARSLDSALIEIDDNFLKKLTAKPNQDTYHRQLQNFFHTVLDSKEIVFALSLWAERRAVSEGSSEGRWTACGRRIYVRGFFANRLNQV